MTLSKLMTLRGLSFSFSVFIISVYRNLWQRFHVWFCVSLSTTCGIEGIILLELNIQQADFFICFSLKGEAYLRIV